MCRFNFLSNLIQLSLSLKILFPVFLIEVNIVKTIVFGVCLITKVHASAFNSLLALEVSSLRTAFLRWKFAHVMGFHSWLPVAHFKVMHLDLFKSFGTQPLGFALLLMINQFKIIHSPVHAITWSNTESYTVSGLGIEIMVLFIMIFNFYFVFMLYLRLGQLRFIFNPFTESEMTSSLPHL